jgi:hypothetical protein
MLTLDKRDCTLGGDSSAKVKEKDGVEIRTLTFEVKEVMLDERELNAFIREPHAWRSLYNDGPDGAVPFLKCFKALELDGSIESAYVALTYGLDANEMAFADCKLSKIKLALCDGGKTALSCKVTTAPTLDETLAELFEQFGNAAEVEIRAEPPGAQQYLPLNKHGDGEQPATPKRGRGRPRKNGERRAH